MSGRGAGSRWFIFTGSRELARTGGHPYGSPLLKQSENQRKKRRFSLFYFYKQKVARPYGRPQVQRENQSESEDFRFCIFISSRQLARTGGHPYGSPTLKQSKN